jgi:hypothetical protein
MLHVWNNAYTTLASGINASQTSMTVTDATVFWDGTNESTKPSPTNPSFLTIITYNTMAGTESTDRTSGRLKVEMVAVTGISSNIVTIALRGVNETIAQSQNAGAYVYKFVDKEDIITLLKFLNLSLLQNNSFNF